METYGFGTQRWPPKHEAFRFGVEFEDTSFYRVKSGSDFRLNARAGTIRHNRKPLSRRPAQDGPRPVRRTDKDRRIAGPARRHFRPDRLVADAPRRLNDFHNRIGPVPVGQHALNNQFGKTVWVNRTLGMAFRDRDRLRQAVRRACRGKNQRDRLIFANSSQQRCATANIILVIPIRIFSGLADVSIRRKMENGCRLMEF